MKKVIEDLQDQKATPNHSVVAEFLKEELIYVRNENLTKTQIIKRITENQHLPTSFNLTVENKNLEVFVNTFDLESLIKKPTCFQSTSPSCIDLILGNKKEFFKNSVLEVGISDHHSLIVTALRRQLVTGNAKTKLYRDYNSFNINLFKEDLDKSLKSNNTVNFSDFQNIFTTVLHKHAPIKKKILRFNNSPFMSKALRKAIMHRPKLKNVYNKKGQM